MSIRKSVRKSAGARPAATLRRLAAAALLAHAALACAQDGAPVSDPLEPMNRAVFGFNEGVDRAVLKPAATAYRDLLPSMVRTGVNNFFGNLHDVWSLANNALQLKPQATAETFMRLNVNTVFGLGGILDVASEAGIERHREDFGQTLGRWGVPAGPYLVLPVLGPSTVRDTAALPLDYAGAPLPRLNDVPVRNSLIVLEAIDARAALLRATQLLDDAALDKYSFTRDAFLQKRRAEVYDGNPPDERD